MNQLTALIHTEPAHPELNRRVHEMHRKALFENLHYTMGFGFVMAVGVVWVLWGRVPEMALLVWLGARAAVAVARLGHGLWTTRMAAPNARRPHDTYRVLALLDAIAWGALGWGLTPLNDLSIAVVSVSVLLSVAALGVFMLYVDFPTAVLFIAPILVPNGLYALLRGDRLGIFACCALIALCLALLREAKRSYRRLIELLRLRVQSEEAVQAKADALKQAEAHADAKSRFLATMSHEMRTPMHGILGMVRVMRQRELHAETLQQLGLVESSGEHLVRVINDVLDFSRLEAGSLPIQQQAYDLEALLHEVVDTSQVLAQDKGLKLQLVYEAPFAGARLAYVMGDPVRLRQVLHNLIGNAIKFTAHGEVNVRARPTPDGQTYLLAVEDTGVGIAPAEQARIFEAFQQAQLTHQRQVGGTGLGLTISRELCRAMGGDLQVRSALGQGSTFTATLPLRPAPAQQQAQPDRPGRQPTAGDAHTDLRPAHVLLVEDNMVNAIVAEAELSHLGVEVETVRSGLEAVRWLRHHRTDLVLMDGDLPELDGLSATRMVRDHEAALQRQRVPIVALSANGSPDFVERCHAAGMDDHLAKPFHAGDLARVLQRHLGHLPAVQQVLPQAA